MKVIILFLFSFLFHFACKEKNETINEPIKTLEIKLIVKSN